MASDGFINILTKKLGSIRMGENTNTVSVESLIESKRMSLTATYKARATEVLSEEDITKITESASASLDVTLAKFADLTVEEMLMGLKTSRESGKLKMKTPGLLRLKSGRIVSALNLAALLNIVLYKYAQRLMGSQGKLVNRTGRLANSGIVTDIVEGKTKPTVSFFYTYQIMPYATFEPGGKQGSEARSPARLFEEAIALALKDLLSPKGGVTERNRLMRFEI